MTGALLLLAALLGCGGTTTAVDSFPDLRAQSGDQSIPLHTTEGRYHFEAPSLEGVDRIQDDFVLDVEEVPNPKRVHRKLRVLRAKLPFNVPGGRFAPPGLSVSIDGEPIAFERGKASMAMQSTWRVNGRHLVLSHGTLPEPGTVVAHWPGLRDRLLRRDPSKSGLEPAEFVRHDVTLDGVTRHGMLLPAPSWAEWDLELPETTTELETWLAVERAPLPEPAPDPVIAVVSIGPVGGELKEVERRTVKRDDPGFGKWTVDLSQWAGQKVTLRLSSEPDKNPWFDWLFLGSPTVRAKATGPVRRVVVLAMDTTRADHVGFNGYPRTTTPELDAIGQQSVAFDRAWSVAPRTRPAFRSAATGRLPLDAVGKTNLAEVFQREGFATAGVVANVHLQPRFDFDHGFDWWHYDNNADADLQVNRALEWLDQNKDRDTFLFLHLMDPHMPYRAPGAYEQRYVTDPDPELPKRYSRFDVNRWSKSNRVSDQRKEHIEALHDGEMAFMSHEVGRFFAQLDELGGTGLTVVHTDHGEEFWDHGAFEHNHSLYDETTRVLLWFRPTGGLRVGRRLPVNASLMDIAPTLYDMLGFTEVPESDGISLAPWLSGDAQAPDRPLPVGYLQYEKERWGVVRGTHKYILHTASGAEELYDLEADPDESDNLAPTADLAPWRTALAEAHHVDVKPGVRIFLKVKPGSDPIRVTFPEPFDGAGVLDPETDLIHRANREWGEPPMKHPEDVGAVEVADDRSSFVFTPGPTAEGILWVQASAPIDPTKIGLERGEALKLAAAPDGARWGHASESIRISAGAVLVPPPGEAARMGIGGTASSSEEERRKLCLLGYLTEGCEEFE